jgi:ribosomal protein S18 acetylase RimI-like enzyme
MEFEIRDMAEDDIPQVIELWQAVGDYHDYLDIPLALLEKARLEKDLFLVAEANSRVIGTVMGGFDGRSGSAARLAVAEDCRRKGVATGLMKELETRLKSKGSPQLSLILEQANIEARLLYEKLGFQASEDIVYMKKFLGEI